MLLSAHTSFFSTELPPFFVFIHIHLLFHALLVCKNTSSQQPPSRFTTSSKHVLPTREEHRPDSTAGLLYGRTRGTRRSICSPSYQWQQQRRIIRCCLRLRIRLHSQQCACGRSWLPRCHWRNPEHFFGSKRPSTQRYLAPSPGYYSTATDRCVYASMPTRWIP